MNQDQEAIKENLWSIDKAINQGQIKAGEVDKSQEEFLRETEWAKEVDR